MRPRVLIVDDHDGFRSMARALLEADGFEVVGEAVDGASAIASAVALTPDVVLLDIQLPDMDGFSVSERLREQAPEAIVILTSSRDATAYGRRLAGSRARGFIPKFELKGPRRQGREDTEPPGLRAAAEVALLRRRRGCRKGSGRAEKGDHVGKAAVEIEHDPL